MPASEKKTAKKTTKIRCRLKLRNVAWSPPWDPASSYTFGDEFEAPATFETTGRDGKPEQVHTLRSCWMYIEPAG